MKTDPLATVGLARYGAPVVTSHCRRSRPAAEGEITRWVGL